MKTQRVDLPDGTSTVIEWHGGTQHPGKGLVAFLPALGVNVAYYRGLCEAWAERGYRVAAIEMRGMKQSSAHDVRRHNFGYREVLQQDLARLVPLLSGEAAGMPLVLAGHSLGGQFALLYASRAPGAIAGVVLLAGGSNHFASLPSWLARQRRRLAFWSIRGVGRTLGYFPGHKLGFGGRQPLNIMLDWSHEGLTGRYRVIGDDTDYNAALERLTTPVLMVSLSGDPLVPRSSAEALAAKLRQAPVTGFELQARDHGLEAFNHFKWVRQPKPVLDPVDDWIQAHATSAPGATP